VIVGMVIPQPTSTITMSIADRHVSVQSGAGRDGIAGIYSKSREELSETRRRPDHARDRIEVREFRTLNAFSTRVQAVSELDDLREHLERYRAVTLQHF
jgi:hypothetical protein